MSYKINTTNQPVDDKGHSELIEVDDAEFVDLQRLGLIRKGAGDVDENGELKSKIAKDAPAEVVNARPATSPIFTTNTES